MQFELGACEKPGCERTPQFSVLRRRLCERQLRAFPTARLLIPLLSFGPSTALPVVRLEAGQLLRVYQGRVDFGVEGLTTFRIYNHPVEIAVTSRRPPTRCGLSCVQHV